MARWMDRLEVFFGSMLPAVLLGIVLVVVTASVIARTILAVPFYMAHDIALLSTAGVVWFGVVGAAAQGQLFGLGYFVGLLPSTLQPLAKALAHVIVIVVALAIIHAAYAQITTARFTRYLALGWPKWIVSAGLLAAMALLILGQLRALWRLLSGTPESPAS